MNNKNYDFEKIGKRIQEERKLAGFKTQGSLAEKVGLSFESRQTVANWESGKAMPQLTEMLLMCNIFKCELGYLLCEYDFKTRAATDIHEETLLSEIAISKLKEYKSNGEYLDDSPAPRTRAINALIENEVVTDAIAYYLFGSINKTQPFVDNESPRTGAPALNIIIDDGTNGTILAKSKLEGNHLDQLFLLDVNAALLSLKGVLKNNG